jgi:hypothetical protein
MVIYYSYIVAYSLLNRKTSIESMKSKTPKTGCSNGKEKKESSEKKH